MRLYYRQDNGDVLYAMYDHEAYGFVHSTNTPLSEFYIEELGVNGNRPACFNLRQTASFLDNEGRSKYYIQDGFLNDRDGWQSRNDGV